jgi:hypothetical protein
MGDLIHLERLKALLGTPDKIDLAFLGVISSVAEENNRNWSLISRHCSQSVGDKMVFKLSEKMTLAKIFNTR